MTPRAAAQDLRNFVTLHRVGTLCTLSHSHPGYPFGSIAPYDVDESGRLILFISRIAEHFRNLQTDPHASLFVADRFGSGDPQAYGRATLLASFAEIPEGECFPVAERYFKRFPEAPGRRIAHDFAFLRGEPERIRWIGGFGDIRWVDGASYRDAVFDPIAYHGMKMIDHMNEDHQDALADIIRAQVGIPEGRGPYRMVAMSSRGFTISYNSGSGKTRIDIPFSKELRPSAESLSDDVRREIIAVLKVCRDRLEATAAAGVA